jgi:1,4-dihydroxy-2-naphthoate octaprenyltransferase
MRSQGLRGWVGLVVRTVRPAIFITTAAPIVLGAVVALHDGSFEWNILILSLTGVVFAHAGVNLYNDYEDHKLGSDEVQENPTFFSGGSRVIQSGEVPARAVLVAAICSFALCALIGLYLALASGWPVLLIGLISGLLIVSYSQLAYTGHGLGELTTFVTSGPLLVGGAYYVQAQSFAPGIWFPAIASGIGVANIVLINEFPDVEPDRAANKNTLAVVLGRSRAATVYAVAWLVAYAAIAAGIASGLMPGATWLAFLTLPLAATAVYVAHRYHDDIPRMLLPANLMTAVIHVLLMVLLATSYLIDM